MLKQIKLHVCNSNLYSVGILLVCLRHFCFHFVAEHQDVLAERQTLSVSRGSNAAAEAGRKREFPTSSAAVQLITQVW